MDYYVRTPAILPYNRSQAVNYAHKWAKGRNPRYYDFEAIGGDCTNFASQVVYSGSGVMNNMFSFGWYYYSENSRSPSWTGVNYLFDFLTGNKGPGPYGTEVGMEDAVAGDLIQLAFNSNDFYNHTPVIVSTGTPVSLDNILVAAHTDDQDNYSVLGYKWIAIRYIHILGVRR